MIMNSPTADTAIPSTAMTTDHATMPPATTGVADVGLLLLRLGVGAATLQAGLIKALDFSTTTQFLAEAGWRLPTVAAFMVTASETLGGIFLLLGVLTPLAACAVLSAMLCAWAVNVSAAAFWSEPFNVPFLIGLGAAALLLTGAGTYSLDRALLRRVNWSKRVLVALLGLAFVAAIVTWVALYGINPIHFSAPSA